MDAYRNSHCFRSDCCFLNCRCCNRKRRECFVRWHLKIFFSYLYQITRKSNKTYSCRLLFSMLRTIIFADYFDGLKLYYTVFNNARCLTQNATNYCALQSRTSAGCFHLALSLSLTNPERQICNDKNDGWRISTMVFMVFSYFWIWACNSVKDARILLQ